MKVLCYPIPLDEYNRGEYGWTAIKSHEDRLIDFSVIQNVTNVDVGSAITNYTWNIVYQGKVYVSHRKYIDLDNNRLIYTFYESDGKCDLEPDEEVNA